VTFGHMDNIGTRRKQQKLGYNAEKMHHCRTHYTTQETQQHTARIQSTTFRRRKVPCKRGIDLTNYIYLLDLDNMSVHQQNVPK
jgi:hypothetical protein